MTRTLTGTLPDGTPVLVTIYADDSAELALRMGGRWGIPMALTEEF